MYYIVENNRSPQDLSIPFLNILNFTTGKSRRYSFTPLPRPLSPLSDDQSQMSIRNPYRKCINSGRMKYVLYGKRVS